MKLVRQGNVGYAYNEKHGYSFEISATERSEIEQRVAEKQSFTDWESRAFTVGEYDVIPFGHDNNLPIEIRSTVNDHNLAPRIFTKKKFLLWGEGPMLYKRTFKEGKPTIEWIEDSEIQSWLESWDYHIYLRQAIEDYNHAEGHFSKIYLAKASRLGAARVSRIDHVGTHLARLAVPRLSVGQPPVRVLVGQWLKHHVEHYQSYPIFNKQKPGAHSVSVHYAHMFGFASDYYARPDVVGSLAWIRRATAIPFILEALTNNSLNIKWHIISPARYWEAKADNLKEQCTLEGKQYSHKMLEDLKDEVFTSLSNVLSGVDNVGKFFQSESFIEIVGATAKEHVWQILPLDQKIKDYVDAQLAISTRSDFTTTAGLGLHQALSNIGGDGKSDSGSEQLYALKNHLLSEVALPESIITEAINIALAINWPNKGLKLGFYRNLPEREEDISSKERVKNAV
jgi:hypothetical protein